MASRAELGKQMGRGNRARRVIWNLIYLTLPSMFLFSHNIAFRLSDADHCRKQSLRIILIAIDGSGIRRDFDALSSSLMYMQTPQSLARLTRPRSCG